MNILYLTPYLPYPGSHGCAAKNWDDLEVLSQRHTFHVVCFLSAADKQRLDALGAMRNVCVYPVEVDSYGRIPARSTRMASIISELCASKLVDIAQVECSFMTRHLPPRMAVPALMTQHQVYWLHFFRDCRVRRNLFSAARMLKNMIEERIWQARYRRIIFFSEHDRDRFQGVIKDASKTRVIPLSIDTQAYKPGSSVRIEHDLCFLGNFESYANIDAAAFFFTDILPIIRKDHPAITTLIVGANAPERLRQLGGAGVRFTGYVADVRAHVASCKVFIDPMRLGSGMRRKVLEAWAMEKPVVSTTTGAEGLHVRNGENIMLADTPGEFASAVGALLGDAQRCGSIGAAGRSTAVRYHDRERTASLIEQQYAQIQGG